MPYIKSESAEQIKEASSLLEVVESCGFSPIKKGSKYFLCSPFRDEKTPSFCIDPVKNRYTDYGGDSFGDSVNFLMDFKRITYPEALIELAKLTNLQPEYDHSEVAERKMATEKLRSQLRPILQSALKHYRDNLKSLKKTHAAWKEIKKRGYTEETVNELGLGFAPGGTFIFDLLKAKNLLREGRNLGLVGDRADKFWNRVIYPIHDKNGLLIAFAGRDVTGEPNAAKWINSQDSPLYNKSQTLYGLHRNAKEIVKSGVSWMVEGYNDVDTLRVHGKENVVSFSGTAITLDQVRLIKRYCKTVVLVLDPDSAGVKAVLRSIPLFILNGVSVYALQLPLDLDPDDFCRSTYFKDNPQETWQTIEASRRDGFFTIMDHELQGDHLDKAKGVHKLTDIIKDVQDITIASYYLKEVSKKSGLTESALRNLMEVKKVEQAEKKVSEYQLPYGVKENIEDLRPIIEKYDLFMSNNRIYIKTGDQKPYNFYDVSNFKIEYLQHINDYDRPMKLIKMTNIFNETYIYDRISQELNTPIGFSNAVSDYGKFNWYGSAKDFMRVRTYLMDHMGTGRKIDILGWQMDGFFALNNKVIIPGSPAPEMSENGVVKIGNTSYYIPSANEIYKNNPLKFANQKLVVIKQAQQPFKDFAKQMVRVHREHAINGLLFSISTIFSDIVFKQVNFFPILFFHGPPSTGKDELVSACQSFFGRPQSKINIGAGISTVKAQIRKFAQFANLVVYLTEYVSGDQKLNEKLKGIWGREGYDKGTIESSVSTDTVAILCSLVLSGNQYPDNDALITRLIIEEMVKSDFTNEDAAEFTKLDEMLKTGISSYLEDMLHERENWKENFRSAYKQSKVDLKEVVGTIVTEERMFNNAAVLGACYKLMNEKFPFPFTYNEFLDHIKKTYTRQVRKLNTGTKLEKFWNLFLSAVRMQNDPLIHEREFKITGHVLTVNMTHTYNKISQLWWQQYQERPPSKNDIFDAIKQTDGLFIEAKDSVRFAEGKKTSAWQLNMNKMSIMEDLSETIEWKKSRTSDNGNDNNGNDNSNPDDLPF
jgi:DNA primase